MVIGMSKDERLMSLLDSFLGEQKEGLSGLEELGSVPVDYVEAYLNTPDDAETVTGSAIRSKTEQLLDTFLSTEHIKPSFSPDEVSGEADETSEAEDDIKQLDDSYFTETLARIYLKQHKYDKALEIIRSLYLNFPNKSIYFADQIRYLEKLVRINQK
jgi:hypothetical protein